MLASCLSRDITASAKLQIYAALKTSITFRTFSKKSLEFLRQNISLITRSSNSDCHKIFQCGKQEGLCDLSSGSHTARGGILPCEEIISSLRIQHSICTEFSPSGKFLLRVPSTLNGVLFIYFLGLFFAKIFTFCW